MLVVAVGEMMCWLGSEGFIHGCCVEVKMGFVESARGCGCTEGLRRRCCVSRPVKGVSV